MVGIVLCSILGFELLGFIVVQIISKRKNKKGGKPA